MLGFPQHLYLIINYLLSINNYHSASKIPRPVVPENPDVFKLKSATSTGNLYTPQRSQSPKMPARSKSNMSPSLLRKPWGYQGPNLPTTRDVFISRVFQICEQFC